LLPGEGQNVEPIWLLQAGNQSVVLDLVHEELTKKGHTLSGRPVTITGYFKKGALVVESLVEDKREKPEPGMQAALVGKLTQSDLGWQMEIEGQTYQIDLGVKPEVQELAKKMKDKLVAVNGALEIAHATDGGGQILLVHAETLRDGQMVMR
jgi:hypothetical protein